MEVVPAFEIGVGNAWILAALLFLIIMLSRLLPGDIGERIAPDEETNKVRGVMLAVFFAMIAYSIFLPLKLGTAWFWVGLAVYILGLAVSGAALYAVGATEPGEPFTSGIYRYSRHPITLGTFLSMMGAGIASASWLFLLLSVILLVVSHFLAVSDESATTRKFGAAYKEYMARTPRWIGLAKSRKA